MGREVFVLSNRSELYNQEVFDGDYVELCGDTTQEDSNHSFWIGSNTSTAADDFSGGVVKPTVLGPTDPGRWLRLYILPDVAKTGDYNDLSNLPAIPDAQVQADWTQSTSGAVDFIKNKPTIKKVETFSGTTNSSGNYTVTFGTAYSATPNIQANIIGGTNTNLIKITSVSTTGFTVNVVNRTDVVGLLPSYANVNGASVQALITEA